MRMLTGCVLFCSASLFQFVWRASSAAVSLIALLSRSKRTIKTDRFARNLVSRVSTCPLCDQASSIYLRNVRSRAARSRVSALIAPQINVRCGSDLVLRHRHSIATELFFVETCFCARYLYALDGSLVSLFMKISHVLARQVPFTLT